jgi:hypothetical protein
MTMKPLEHERKMDELLSRAIGRQGLEADFEAWKQEHQDQIRRIESQMDRSKATCSTQRQIWRTVMKSRTAKLAAAAIIVAAMAGVHKLAGPISWTPPVYGITDVPRLLRQSETVHITGWASDLKFPVKGEEHLDRHHMEQWYDLRNGRSRTTGLGLIVMMPDEERSFYKFETIFDGQYKMQMNHSTKSVKFHKLSTFMRMLSVRRTLERSLERIALTADELAGFEKTGQDRIDDVDFDIWEKQASYDGAGMHKHKYWISSATGKISRYEGWKKGQEPDGRWRLITEEEIELDVPVPEHVFNTEAPVGYRSSNSKETASTLRPLTQPFGWRDSVQGEIAIALALPTGTAIMGWYAEDPASEDPHAELSEDLAAGGPLPQMPVEIAFGLSPKHNPESITYLGRHLAVTEKDEKLYEWAVFVPNEDIDAECQSRRSKVRIRLRPGISPDAEEKDHYDFSVETLIVAKQEFDIFVRSAMAELSQDGLAPEHITYENLLRLTDDIRASMEQ